RVSSLSLLLFPRPPTSTLFPYTTLFRSTLPTFPIWHEATLFESRLIWDFFDREQSCHTANIVPQIGKAWSKSGIETVSYQIARSSVPNSGRTPRPVSSSHCSGCAATQNPCGSPHKALQAGRRRYEGGCAGSEPPSPACQERQTRAPASPGRESCWRRCRLQGKEGQPVTGLPPRMEPHRGGGRPGDRWR